MKKYFLALLLIVFIAPSVAFASWWNPFIWNWPWVKKITPPEEILQPDLATEEINTREEKTVTPSPEKTEEKKVSTPIKPTTPAIPITTSITSTTVITPPAPTTNTPPVVELSIYDVSIDEKVNSVRVNWETSVKSESKIILDGKSYFSKRGIGTEHYADIDGLKSDTSYDGTITAIANNGWKNKNFNFTTKPVPFQITKQHKGCSSDNCILSWETNYLSKGNIKVYKVGSSQVVKSLISSSLNSKTHCLEFKLTPDTKYNFEINASNDKESAKVTGELQVPAKLTQAISGGVHVSQLQYACPS